LRAPFSIATRQIVRLMLPAMLGAAVYQIAILISTMLASVLPNGSVSWLSYADRLAQLPIGIFTVALASVLLPTLSNAAAEQDHKGFCDNLINALRYTSFCIIPVSVGIFFYAEPLTRVVFERSRFGPADTARTALAVQAMCVGLWGVSCSSMAMRAFIARKQMWTPALIGTLSLVLGVVVSLLLMGPARTEAEGALYSTIIALQAFLSSHFFTLSLGHAGLAASAGLAQTFCFLVLALSLQRQRLGIRWDPFLSATYKTLAASAIMYLALLGWSRLLPLPLAGMLSGIPLGVLVFIAACAVFRSTELRESCQALVRVVNLRRKGRH
jgi:putative peptidoglycan lipid II flippase